MLRNVATDFFDLMAVVLAYCKNPHSFAPYLK